MKPVHYAPPNQPSSQAPLLAATACDGGPPCATRLTPHHSTHQQIGTARHHGVLSRVPRGRWVITAAHPTDAPAGSSRYDSWTSRVSRVLWQLAPGVALLLQQASSTQPSVAAYLTAEFISMTDNWKATRIAQLPPARRQGLEGLAEGWQVAQERYHLFQAAAAAVNHNTPSDTPSIPPTPVSEDALLRWVLPDPVSLVSAPVLLRSGGTSLRDWLSSPTQPSGEAEAELYLDKQHSFLMRQVIELILAPGQERLVQPFPPTPRPKWLCSVAERMIAAAQALQQPSDASSTHLENSMALLPGAKGLGATAAAQSQCDSLLREQALAHMRACVYMPIKDALTTDLGSSLLCASWVYQVVTATMVLYCSNASHNTPDKLIICQAVAADLADGVRILQQARVPLADHVLLYLAVQQLGLLLDLQALGMDQAQTMAQVAGQVTQLAQRISTRQPGLIILFDAYCRLGEYHLHVMKQYNEAVQAFRQALAAFRAREAVTWDGFQEWSDDLSGCALYSSWRYMCDAQLQAAHPTITLTHLPEALFLHRDRLCCITQLLVAEQQLVTSQSPDTSAASPAQQAARDAQAPLQTVTQLLAAATRQLITEPASQAAHQDMHQSGQPAVGGQSNHQASAHQAQAAALGNTPACQFGEDTLSREYLASTLAMARLLHQHEQGKPSSYQEHHVSKQNGSKQQTGGHKQAVTRQVAPMNGASPRSHLAPPRPEPVPELSKPRLALWNDLTAPEPGLGLLDLSKDLVQVFARSVQQDVVQFKYDLNYQAHFLRTWLQAHPGVFTTGQTEAHREQLKYIQPFCQHVLRTWGSRPPGVCAEPGSVWQDMLAFACAVEAATVADDVTPGTMPSDTKAHVLVPLLSTPLHVAASQVLSHAVSVPEGDALGAAAAPVIRHALAAGATQDALTAVQTLVHLSSLMSHIPRSVHYMDQALYTQLVCLSQQVMQSGEGTSSATQLLELIQGWRALDSLQLLHHGTKAAHTPAAGSGSGAGSVPDGRSIRFKLLDELCGAAVQYGANSWLLQGALQRMIQGSRYDAGGLDALLGQAASAGTAAAKRSAHGTGTQPVAPAPLPRRLVQAVLSGIDQPGGNDVLLQLVKAVLQSCASSQHNKHKAPGGSKGLKPGPGVAQEQGDQDGQQAAASFITFTMSQALGVVGQGQEQRHQRVVLGTQVAKLASETGALSDTAVVLLLKHALLDMPGSSQSLQLVTQNVLNSLPSHTLCTVLDQVVEEQSPGVPHQGIIICAWISKQVNPRLCRAYQPSKAALQQLLISSHRMSASPRQGPQQAVKIAAGLQAWVQVATPKVLAGLLGAAVTQAQTCHPTAGVSQQAAYTHHITAAMTVFHELNVQWADAHKATRPPQTQSASRAFPTPAELADVCAQLLQLLSLPGQTAPLVLPYTFQDSIDARGARARSKQGTKDEGVRAVKSRLLTMAYEQSMAMCSEQLTGVVPPATLLATCQAYLAQGSIQQAVGVALSASKPNSAIIMAHLFTNRKFTQAQVLHVGVLVALVQQACELRNPTLLEHAIHLVMDRQQIKPLLQCLRRQTFAGMLLLLLRQPPTPTCSHLIKAWLSHRAGLAAPAAQMASEGAPDVLLPMLDTSGLQLNSSVWAGIARAALQHARPGTPRATVSLVVQVVLLCAPQMNANQATAIRMAAAGAALECGAGTDLASQALAQVFIPSPTPHDAPTYAYAAAVLPGAHAASVPPSQPDPSRLLDSGIILLNKCGGLRGAQLGEAREQVVQMSEWVMEQLFKQPLQVQQQLSEAAHRSVILWLCEDRPAAAIKAWRFWGYLRPGLRLSRDSREQVLIAAVRASEWDLCNQLCGDLLGPEWSKVDGASLGPKWQTLPLATKHACLAALAAGHGRVEHALSMSQQFTVKAVDSPTFEESQLPAWLLDSLLQGLMNASSDVPKHSKYVMLAWILCSCSPRRQTPANIWIEACAWPKARGEPLLTAPPWWAHVSFPAPTLQTVSLARQVLAHLGYTADDSASLLGSS